MSTDGPEPQGSSEPARTARGLLLHPATLVPIPVWILFALGRHYGFVADEPLWLLFGALLVAQVTTLGFAMKFPPGTDRAKPVASLGVEIAVIGLVIYVTGWGATLAVGFVYAAVSHMSSDGSRLARPAMLFTVITIAIGEGVVALGWVLTLQPEPQGHGLAMLEAAGVCAVVWIMSFSQHEKEAADASLRRSEERLSALVQHASDAVVVMEADGTVMYSSPAVERLLGYPPEELTQFGLELLHEDYFDQALALFDDIHANPSTPQWLEIPMKHASGDFRWFEVGVTNLLDDPAVHGLVCNMRDITERRSATQQLTFQAYHDALTRLPNRWLFVDRLEQAQREAHISDGYVGVLFLDIDRFKMINDSLGHEIGDRMLVSAADRLTACCRPGDIVARFGGDEFAIMLPLDEPDTALRVADRIVDLMREPLSIDGHDLYVSASVGVAISHSGTERASDLLRQADLAMYVAKEKGRARWELFDPSFAPKVQERLQLEGDLWRALEHGELMVHFQPEISLATGRVTTAEALIRWNHPRRGLLEPEAFVALAEESRLIVAIDRFVLRESCRWARRWSADRTDEAPVVVSVNLSPRFMRQADMVSDVTSILRQSGVDPRGVQLEITERSALTDLEVTCNQLHQLRAIGVRVAVDDFGTGYSSLSYLKQLPIDVLKLDKSFIDDLDGAPVDAAIVQAIITMGHALGVKVTAEGVERAEQVARLRELGCDTAMGWLWSRAVPPEQLRAIAASGFAPDAREAVVVPLRARA